MINWKKVASREVCWKHNRQVDNTGDCLECNGKPPAKPVAWGDEIHKAAVILSYAFPYANEAQRECLMLHWEAELRDIIQKEYYIQDEKDVF